MWKASSAANKKRSMRDIQRKKASHGDFAASAVAMFKDTDTDEQEGADGVVGSRRFPYSFGLRLFVLPSRHL